MQLFCRHSSPHLRLLSVIVVILLNGCTPNDSAVATAPKSAVSAPVDGMQATKDALGVGGVGYETVSVTGRGKSAGDALDDAIRQAIMQVNGASVDLNSARYSFTMRLSDGRKNADIRAEGYAQAVETSSNGVIQSLKVMDQQSNALTKNVEVTVSAKVAKYTASAEMERKLKIVLSPIQFSSTQISIAGQSFPSSQVSEEINQRVTAALTNTQRFVVLDRSANAEIAGELDIILSGQTPAAQMTKLGQAFSADLLWVGKIKSFGFAQNIKKAQDIFEDDRIVESGGFAFEQRLINVSSRQVLNSASGKGTFDRPHKLDPQAMLAGAEDHIAKSIVASILEKTFPVGVVKLDGDRVTLNHGAAVLRQNARYAVVLLGSSIKDPQTGIVLGSEELACCDVVIDSVTPTIAQGHLENIRIDTANVQANKLQIKLAELPVSTVASTGAAPPKSVKSTAKPTAKDQSGSGKPDGGAKTGDADAGKW